MVQVDVGHDGHAAVPGVRRIEPTAQPDLDEGDVQLGLGEVAEDHGREQLELGRVAVAPGDPVGDRQDRLDVTGEVVGADRPAVDDDPLAIGHEVRLRGLADAQAGGAQGTAGERQHAALAVRARDERATHGELGIAEGSKERARPPEAQPDAEPAAVGQCGERLVVVEGLG